MRFDQAESAVVQNGCGLHGARSWLLASEPEVVLALVGAETVRAVHSVLGAISAMKSTQGLRCFGPSSFCVGGANHGAPRPHGILANELHADDYIALDELLQTGKEGLVAMLSVETFS